MRKTDLRRISDAGKKLADSIYKKLAIEIDREYSHVKVNELTFQMMRQEEKVQYFQLYASWLKAKVRARLETYLDAFKDEGVIPNEADLSDMVGAFKGVIDSFADPLPVQLQRYLNQLGDEQILPAARRDIDLFSQRMSIEQMRADARQQQLPSSVHYNIQIGENRGPIQQGGAGNIQSTNRSDDEVK